MTCPRPPLSVLSHHHTNSFVSLQNSPFPYSVHGTRAGRWGQVHSSTATSKLHTNKGQHRTSPAQRVTNLKKSEMEIYFYVEKHIHPPILHTLFDELKLPPWAMGSEESCPEACPHSSQPRSWQLPGESQKPPPKSTQRKKVVGWFVCLFVFFYHLFPVFLVGSFSFGMLFSLKYW